MEHGTELWSLISPPLHHIFYDQNLIIVALIPTQWWRAYAHWTWGWTPTFVSCYCVLSFLQQVTVVRTKGMMEKLGQCLSQLQTSVNQIKPSFSLNDKNKCELAKVTHLGSFGQPSFHLLALQTSEASVAVLGSPGSCRAFTASMMQCWTTAAHGGGWNAFWQQVHPRSALSQACCQVLHLPAAQALQHTLAPWVWTSALLVAWTNPKFLSVPQHSFVKTMLQIQRTSLEKQMYLAFKIN